MIVKNVSIDSVNLYPENPREMDSSQFEKLKASLKEFGFVSPIVVNLRNHESFTDKDREIAPVAVGGHMRWRAARENGNKEVPIVEIDISKTKEAVLNIALNKISGKWDIGKLEKMVYELSSADLDIDLDLTGLEDWEQKLYNPAEDIDHEEIEKIVGGDDKPTHIMKIVFANEEDFTKASRIVGGDKRVRNILRGEKLMAILEVYEQNKKD